MSVSTTLIGAVRSVSRFLYFAFFVVSGSHDTTDGSLLLIVTRSLQLVIPRTRKRYTGMSVGQLEKGGRAHVA